MAESKNSGHSSSAKSLFQKLYTLGRKLSFEARPEDVHQLRTTSRRIETLVAAHKDHLGRAASKVVKRTAKLRRKAGKVRDLDVQIAALRGMTIESITRDKSRLIADLERERQKRDAKLVGAVKSQFDSTFRTLIAKVQGQFSKIANDAARPSYAALALDKFAAMMPDFAVLDDKNLHAFRIACKHVRYIAELSDTPEAAAIVAECKYVQDAIGEWHDFVMLTTRAERLFPRNRSPLNAALRTLKSTKLSEALRAAADVQQKVMRMRPDAHPKPASESLESRTMAAS